jgi:hypothetical protein
MEIKNRGSRLILHTPDLMEWSAPLPKRPQKGHDVNAFKRHIEMRQTMKDCKANSEIKVLGIDLAKQSFQLHGVVKPYLGEN